MLTLLSYDTALMGSFMGYTSFKNRYGTETDSEGNKIISAPWQTGLQNGVQVGSIVCSTVASV